MFTSTTTASRRVVARFAIAGALTALPMAAVSVPVTAEPTAPSVQVEEVRHNHGGYWDRCDRDHHDRWNHHHNQWDRCDHRHDHRPDFRPWWWWFWPGSFGSV